MGVQDRRASGAAGGAGARIAWPARLGYAVHGLLYLAIGGLALLAALGSAGMTVGTRAVLRGISDGPAGRLALAFLAAGFAGHAAWRFAQAVLDADRRGSNLKGLATRGGKLAGALASAALAAYALGVLFGWGMDATIRDGGRGDWAAWLLHHPVGRWLAGAAGALVLVGGLVGAVGGWRRDFGRDFDMDGRASRLATRIMRFGLVAHGLVTAGVGLSIAAAAAWVDVRVVRGLGDLLDLVQRQPLGGVLLALLSLGLMSFGLGNLMSSVWRRVRAPPPP